MNTNNEHTWCFMDNWTWLHKHRLMWNANEFEEPLLMCSCLLVDHRSLLLNWVTFPLIYHYGAFKMSCHNNCAAICYRKYEADWLFLFDLSIKLHFKALLLAERRLNFTNGVFLCKKSSCLRRNTILSVCTLFCWHFHLWNAICKWQ